MFMFSSFKMWIKFFIFIFISVSFTNGGNVSPGIISRALRIVGKCNKEHPLDSTEMEKAVRHFELPSSEEGKCFLACFLEEFGLVAEGQINLEKSQEFNKMHFTDPEDLKKANDVSSVCKEELSTLTAEACEFAFAAGSCMLEKSKSMGFNLLKFKQ